MLHTNHKMPFLVARTNSEVLKIELDSKSMGNVLLEKVCEKLGIMGPESEYFGLQYTGRKGESLWLNTRNQIDRCLQAPCRLKLKVKFFVQPHLLLQESTRHEFYLQIVEDFLQGALTVTQRHQLIKMASLIAQVETPYHNSQNINLESYTTFIPEPILRDLHNSDDTSELRSLVQDVCSEHSKLGDLTSSLASYKVLQEATLVPNWGVEYYDVLSECERVQYTMGVGPEGITLSDMQHNIIQSMAYSAVLMATFNNRNFCLTILDDFGEKRTICFKLISDKASVGLYRCVTEKHSFYKSDTIRNEVNDQYSRDLKGIIVSMFDEHTSLGKKYIFDIKRTSREVYDQTRRQLHAQGIPDLRLTDIKDGADLSSENCCIICMDSKIQIRFSPCGHTNCCSSCSSMISQCPLCRAAITTMQHVLDIDRHGNGDGNTLIEQPHDLRFKLT